MQEEYVAPKLDLDAFNCPVCKAYAKFNWWHLGLSLSGSSYAWINENYLKFAKCSRCENLLLWHGGEMIIPATSTAPLPHKDMPEKIKAIYKEAHSILNKSPKGACALLRLALQKFVDELVEGSGDINAKIAKLVKQGLPPGLQKAFDIVRLVGNNAVHPGVINIDDNPEIAQTLFKLINMIVEKMITEPKELESFYSSMPEKQREAIAKRDA